MYSHFTTLGGKYHMITAVHIFRSQVNVSVNVFFIGKLVSHHPEVDNNIKVYRISPANLNRKTIVNLPRRSKKDKHHTRLYFLLQ